MCVGFFSTFLLCLALGVYYIRFLSDRHTYTITRKKIILVCCRATTVFLFALSGSLFFESINVWVFFFKFIFMLHASHIDNNTVCSSHALTQWNLAKPYSKKKKVEPILQLIKTFLPPHFFHVLPPPILLFSLSLCLFLSVLRSAFRITCVLCWFMIYVNFPLHFFYFLRHVIISLTLSVFFLIGILLRLHTSNSFIYSYWHQTKLIVFFIL